MNIGPVLTTFDIFGTVLDWRAGLEQCCRFAGRPILEGEFDRIVDAQASLEQGSYADYASITCRSLIDVIGLAESKAVKIATGVGHWPLYEDAPLLRALMRMSPCAAMTNSDRAHGEDVQAQLGFRLHDWLCSEDTRVYKPNPDFWRQMSVRSKMRYDRHWWHVSAYADYDLHVANDLGLTTVLVRRPHARSGKATYEVDDLHGLLDLVRQARMNCPA